MFVDVLPVVVDEDHVERLIGEGAPRQRGPALLEHPFVDSLPTPGHDQFVVRAIPGAAVVLAALLLCGCHLIFPFDVQPPPQSPDGGSPGDQAIDGVEDGETTGDQAIDGPGDGKTAADQAIDAVAVNCPQVNACKTAPHGLELTVYPDLLPGSVLTGMMVACDKSKGCTFPAGPVMNATVTITSSTGKQVATAFAMELDLGVMGAVNYSFYPVPPPLTAADCPYTLSFTWTVGPTTSTADCVPE